MKGAGRALLLVADGVDCGEDSGGSVERGITHAIAIDLHAMLVYCDCAGLCQLRQEPVAARDGDVALRASALLADGPPLARRPLQKAAETALGS